MADIWCFCSSIIHSSSTSHSSSLHFGGPSVSHSISICRWFGWVLRCFAAFLLTPSTCFRGGQGTWACFLSLVLGIDWEMSTWFRFVQWESHLEIEWELRERGVLFWLGWLRCWNISPGILEVSLSPRVKSLPEMKASRESRVQEWRKSPDNFVWAASIQRNLRLPDIHTPGKTLILDSQLTEILEPKARHSEKAKERSSDQEQYNHRLYEKKDQGHV